MLNRPVEQVAPIRAKVIAKGVAFAPAHGDTAFTVRKFDEYMKRAIPEFAPKIARRRKARSRPKSATRAQDRHFPDDLSPQPGVTAAPIEQAQP
jgi:cysteinyl-tRNA synthetase